MESINLNGKWLIKAPIKDIFNIMTDFEKFPVNFPKVADSIQIVKREGNHLKINATVKSFGRKFPVTMRTEIIPDKGFISDNDSPEFGTSGHEELLLTEHPDGTLINYTYQVTIHKRWLRIIARPLIGWFSMKFWEKAVIDELKRKLQ